VVGGLMFSQLVTLYLTPVFYTYMAALQTRLGRNKPKPRTMVREPEPVATGD
jgi:HAE1 family hydrophobic/amphiphilic exporter-1